MADTKSFNHSVTGMRTDLRPRRDLRPRERPGLSHCGRPGPHLQTKGPRRVTEDARSENVLIVTVGQLRLSFGSRSICKAALPGPALSDKGRDHDQRAPQTHECLQNSSTRCPRAEANGQKPSFCPRVGRKKTKTNTKPPRGGANSKNSHIEKDRLRASAPPFPPSVCGAPRGRFSRC